MNKIAAPRGWHSRGYLPHFDGGSVPQSVTIRLADSFPTQRLDEWRRELTSWPENEASTELRQRIEAYLDAGSGNAWLRDPRIAQLVESALLRFDGDRYRLHAWVIMPNHVHVLFTPRQDSGLSEIVPSWKSYTAKMANRILRRTGKFWQEEYFDRYIRNEGHYWAAVEYIEQNPVKAGLCTSKGQWKFGSAWRRATNAREVLKAS